MDNVLFSSLNKSESNVVCLKPITSIIIFSTLLRMKTQVLQVQSIFVCILHCRIICPYPVLNDVNKN